MSLILFRYTSVIAMPRYIITDIGKLFVNKLMTSHCEKFKFAQHKYSIYNALANGLTEAFNKTVCSGGKV